MATFVLRMAPREPSGGTDCGLSRGKEMLEVPVDRDQRSRTRTISWRDPAISAEAARTLRGSDFVGGIISGEIPAPPTFELIGFRLIEVEPGEVSGQFEPAEFHYNPLGGVHGGIVCFVLDSVMGLAVHSQLPAGRWFATLEMKTQLVRPISESTASLFALGKVVHPGARIATAESRLVDKSGKLFAHGTATCMILSKTT